MQQIMIAQPDSVLQTSLALSHDVLMTANRVALGLGRPRPFAIKAIKTPPSSFRGCDALVIPGQGVADAAHADGLLAAPQTRAWIALIRKAHAHGTLIVSSCSGVLLLAEAGILAGRNCTTSWFLAPHLSRLHPEIQVDADAMVVEDRRIITGGAAMGQGDAMLALVKRLAGFEIANLTARYLLLDNRRSQADSRLVRPLVAGDPMLVKAERWARSRLDKGVCVPALAAAVGTTSRTLARRLAVHCGMSPMAFINHIRREEALQLLAGGSRFDQAAYAVGYRDPSALRRLLSRRSRREGRTGATSVFNPDRSRT